VGNPADATKTDEDEACAESSWLRGVLGLENLVNCCRLCLLGERACSSRLFIGGDYCQTVSTMALGLEELGCFLAVAIPVPRFVSLVQLLQVEAQIHQVALRHFVLDTSSETIPALHCHRLRNVANNFLCPTGQHMYLLVT
jgi:hypothetical protein